MKIKRFEFGITKYGGNIKLKNYLSVSYLNCNCGCKILSLSIFYITWLDKECPGYNVKLDIL